MFKKYACYLSICLLAAPFVACAEEPLPGLPTLPPVPTEMPIEPQSPLQAALISLPQACPTIGTSLNGPALDQLRAFYQQQDWLPVWADGGQLPALHAQLQLLADDGLNPKRYPVALTAPQDGELCADIEISRYYLQALQDLHYGRLLQSHFEPLWHSDETPRDRQAELLAIAVPGVHNVPAAFDLARPQLAQYQNLRHLYAAQRLKALPQWTSVGNGPLLRPDMEDKRVPELARRLYSEGYLSSVVGTPDNAYHGVLVEAVKSFQANHSLQADGVVGPGTIAELNISPLSRREQLRVNLERFRWMAQDMEPDGLLVNVAAAELTLYQGGLPVWQTRTQVGRAERQTPLLKSRVTRLTLNPTWTVPPTIWKEDKLPEIRKDQTFLSRQNLQVLDANGQPLAAADIDWDNPGNILLRQDAGPRNPLGQMVIRFPNPFSVYLHDTPSKALFDKGPRAFSSGCVRVEHPMKLRDFLLSPAEKARTDTLLATGTTHEFRLSNPVPILMTYWTAQVDGQGRVLYAPDIYSRDSALLAGLDRAH
ncbi:murein L,D-transpeptidase [Pseudomonas sp. GW456-12-10-14-LB2]|uniref:L,D-transpeptidase family protein n=1 Tax=Pseudomonas sp. GW456-12-10-14-LB2 TaxID=2070674 RepID=UPI000C9993A7|nr:L,D-transpeptidase family protein [Pseudomonas sp. GW456-12-10-14-LB2]PNB49702.1 murein L,D-transpeptidase [Pseudomonas sp. GW456-12-10-14-LB2]